MPLPRRLARFNVHVTNRIQGTWAWRLAPWVVVIHAGRRSGRTYRTPIFGHVGRDQVVLPVLYGTESDWVRNVLAAGGGAVTRAGVTRAIANARLVARKDYATLPRAARPVTLPAGHAIVADLGDVIARGNPRDLTLAV